MGNNHLKKGLIPKSASQQTLITKYINKDASSLDNLLSNGNNSHVLVSIKYIQHSFQCFSDWSQTEMKDFWNFSDNIHNQTWQQVYGSARKKDKTGLAYTTINLNQYPESEFKSKFSPDITAFELRVSQKARVHGFRLKSVFFICWLDKNHEIT